MKIGIVGAGFVGAAAGSALVLQGRATEIVFVDRDAAKAEGEAMDIAHATPFSHGTRVTAGDYADLDAADVVVIAAGANQRPGETRLDLAAKNAAIFRDIVPRIVAASPHAILCVATNPVDVLTHVTAVAAREAAGVDPRRVIGSGTTLDTARLRALVAHHAGVSPKNVHGYVLGEHGDSEIIAWSGIRIGGEPIANAVRRLGGRWATEDRAAIDRDVRRAAYDIIERKGATYFGVGAALSRIVGAIGADERSVLTVAMSHDGVAYSLPRVLGRDGVLHTLEPHLDADERAALEASVTVIRDAIDGLG